MSLDILAHKNVFSQIPGTSCMQKAFEADFWRRWERERGRGAEKGKKTTYGRGKEMKKERERGGARDDIFRIKFERQKEILIDGFSILTEKHFFEKSFHRLNTDVKDFYKWFYDLHLVADKWFYVVRILCSYDSACKLR